MSVKIHPFKGYLNTKFNVFVQGKEQNYLIFRKNHADESPILSGKVSPNIPNDIVIPTSGEFCVKFEGGEEFIIQVEDGYKFGGGNFKKSFIFDNCPWCFVVMHDRTYFYNRETRRSYVESISPDNILLISSKYVLLENNGQEERSIFSLDDESPVLCVSNIVTYNENLIVWEECIDNNKNLCIVTLPSSSVTIDRFPVEGYTLGKEIILYYFKDKVRKISLSNYSGAADCISPNKGKIVSIVAPNLVISFMDNNNDKRLLINNIDTGECIKSIETKGNLAEINNNKIIDIWERQHSLELLDVESLGIPEINACAIYHSFNFFACEWEVFYTCKTYKISKKGNNRVTRTEESVLRGIFTNLEIPLKNAEGNFCTYRDAVCFYNSSESFTRSKLYDGSGYICGGSVYLQHGNIYLYQDSHLYTLSRNGFWDNVRELSLDFSDFSEFGVVKNKDTKCLMTLRGIELGKWLARLNIEESCIKTSDDYYIFSDARIIQTSEIRALPDYLSKSLKNGLKVTDEGVLIYTLKDGKFISVPIMEDIFNSKKYHDVLLSEDGKYILHRKSDKTIVTNIADGSTQNYENMSYIKHINGIRPLFETPSSLQPRLIDPITGQHINCGKMSQYQFISPDGTLYADTSLERYIEYYCKDTGSLVSQEQFYGLIKKFSYPLPKEKDSVDSKKIAEARKQFILEHFDYINEKHPNLLNNDKTGKTWNTVVIDEKNNYGVANFLGYVIGKRGIAEIRLTADDSEYARINLGAPLEFVNYVSFSQDSKYVAIAGYRSSGGLLLIYDLKSKKTITYKDTYRAVWNVAFSAKNAFASYTSSPDTFFAANESEYTYENFNNRLIIGNNFLTFSPDGNLFALSRQGYISKYDKEGNVRSGWGHQPSSMVEIRKSTDHTEKIFTFTDLGDTGISGTSKRNAVASVSFSNDNTRLMMVGNDGVVIIRNIHIDI